ncbi:hypothetical protein FKR81_17120 [Lentzea tibetensis]|uniref:Uncharacterized protein n=1 Tax=Lentzea tibetensis TaxID=2591470 RepID=A0A563EUV7_9PSEU|nr:hypothetical protein [Lentzea tibetensis]TWP51328.1 hypothetical protein FKR81_17120 [Lentzea tibetensis]
MLAGILIMLLMFEAEILSRGITLADVWVSRLKKVLLTSTLVMNVWPAIAPWATGREPFDAGNLAIHLIVPIVVFGVAEVMPVIQQMFNEAITRAYHDANQARPAMPAESATPAPHTVPTPSAALATGTALRLPDSILTPVKAKAAALAAKGRELTVDDVQAVVRVKPDMAAQIAAEITARNGHVFT